MYNPGSTSNSWNLHRFLPWASLRATLVASKSNAMLFETRWQRSNGWSNGGRFVSWDKLGLSRRSSQLPAPGRRVWVQTLAICVCLEGTVVYVINMDCLFIINWCMMIIQQINSSNAELLTILLSLVWLTSWILVVDITHNINISTDIIIHLDT